MELSDETIENLWMEYYPSDELKFAIEFARAIIRAYENLQEK